MVVGVIVGGGRLRREYSRVGGLAVGFFLVVVVCCVRRRLGLGLRKRRFARARRARRCWSVGGVGGVGGDIVVVLCLVVVVGWL